MSRIIRAGEKRRRLVAEIPLDLDARMRALDPDRRRGYLVEFVTQALEREVRRRERLIARRAQA